MQTACVNGMKRLVVCSRRVVALMEEDIRPADRYLIERGIFASARVIDDASGPRLQRAEFEPPLRILSLDIETTLRADRILSVALQSQSYERVLFNGNITNSPAVVRCHNERDLLQQLMAEVRRFDPDLIIGWNVIGFDLRVLQQRAEAQRLPLCLGRDQEPVRVEQTRTGRWYARLNGRVVLDGIDTLKGATWQFERYSPGICGA